MTSTRLAELMENVEIKDGKLYKDGEVVVAVGDKFRSKVNTFREYECESISGYTINMAKIKVGDFENSELGKWQEFQVGHFLNDIGKFQLI